MDCKTAVGILDNMFGGEKEWTCRYGKAFYIQAICDTQTFANITGWKYDALLKLQVDFELDDEKDKLKITCTVFDDKSPKLTLSTPVQSTDQKLIYEILQFLHEKDRNYNLFSN